MGIQVLHRGRFHAGLAQRLLHGPAAPLPSSGPAVMW